jgi:sortase (surface protein transpeptidase)
MVGRHSRRRTGGPAWHAARPRRAVVMSAAAVSVAAVIFAAFLIVRGSASSPAPTSSRATGNPPAALPPPGRAAGALPPLPHGPTGPAHEAAPTTSGAALPADLTIPAIDVHTALEPLGLLPDGALRPPSHWDEAGWYSDGTRPGDAGPAVIIGHVDSTSGPAVFYRLRDLRSGERAFVRLRTGRTLTFVIDTITTYPKKKFPSVAVYGPTAFPELRLVTCTGDFDHRTHSYVDNLVVTAHLKR